MATPSSERGEPYDIAAMGERHDEIREQLSSMEKWIEALPLTRPEDRRDVMQRIVDFLQRYVLVDARQEERNLFPSAGARAEVLRAEHGFIERWVHELSDIARGATDAMDGVTFRATAFKLFGLLEAHMHCEEVVLGHAASTSTSTSTSTSSTSPSTTSTTSEIEVG